MRVRSERGAVLAEATLVTPLFFLVLFSVFGSALLMTNILSTRYGATDGARAAAIAGQNPSADWDALQAVQRASINSGAGSIEQVVIYKADEQNAPVSAQCLVAPTSSCNVYGASDLTLSQSDFLAPGFTKDDHWKASSRSTSRQAGTDYVGVYVKIRTAGIVRWVPVTSDSNSVSRIEAIDY